MIGRTLSHFRIHEKLGAGGMGEVYRATDTRLGRDVAIKVLPEAFAGNPERLARFEQEARLLASLNHPNIAAIHGLEESDGTRFLVLELVPGDTLAERIARGALPVGESVRICRQIAEALEAAHGHAIIHRDLKPANVKVTPDGKVKVLDFGLAKAFKSAPAEAVDLSQSPTASLEASREGIILGTASYMSPEQALARELEPRTDLFSLGVVLYEMVTGSRPFTGDTPTALIDSILHRNPSSPNVLNKAVDRKLSRLIGRCLKKEKEDRYPSARDLLGDLRRCEPTGVRSRRRTYQIAAAAVLLVLAAAAAGWWFSRVRWARTEAIAEIERLAAEADQNADWALYEKAFEIGREAECYIGDDPALKEALKKCSSVNYPLTVETDPLGARVHFKNYAYPEREWTFLGRTPLREQLFPFGYYIFRMEKESFARLETVVPTWAGQWEKAGLQRKLDPLEEISPGMVRVVGGEVEAVGELPDFFIDRYEVTNRQFKAFVDAGGYRDPAHWRQPFVDGGKTVHWN